MAQLVAVRFPFNLVESLPRKHGLQLSLVGPPSLRNCSILSFAYALAIGRFAIATPEGDILLKQQRYASSMARIQCFCCPLICLDSPTRTPLLWSLRFSY